MEKYLYICVGGTFLGYQDEIMIMDNQSKIASKWIGTAYGDTSPSIKYIFPDHLGSSNTLCDDSGAFYNREEYYPFGETSFGSYGKKRYRFCGKERDEESGMYYYGARYYLSWTCRFVSVDPLAGKYPWSSYVYAGNRPIVLNDINGEGPKKHGHDHIVISGETLTGIANLEGTTVEAIHKANPIDTKDINNIEVGAKLYIPDQNRQSKTKDASQSVAVSDGLKAVRASKIRGQYHQKDAKLEKKFKTTLKRRKLGSWTRNDYIFEERKITPQPYRAVAEMIKPTKTLKNNPNGSFWKSNPKVDTRMKYVGYAGKLLLGYGLYSSGRTISQSNDKGQAIVKEGFSWGGAIAGGEALGELGGSIRTSIGGPIGGVMGAFTFGIGGSIVGGIYGKKFAESLQLGGIPKVKISIPLFPRDATSIHPPIILPQPVLQKH